MPDNLTREGRWSSRGFFGLRAGHKKNSPEKPSQRFGDAAVDSREPDSRSRKDLSTSQPGSASSSTAEKLRRHGSRLLSVIRLHGSSGDRGSTGKADFRSQSESLSPANVWKTLRHHPSACHLLRLRTPLKMQLFPARTPSQLTRRLCYIMMDPNRLRAFRAKTGLTHMNWLLMCIRSLH